MPQRLILIVFIEQFFVVIIIERQCGLFAQLGFALFIRRSCFDVAVGCKLIRFARRSGFNALHPGLDPPRLGQCGISQCRVKQRGIK